MAGPVIGVPAGAPEFERLAQRRPHLRRDRSVPGRYLVARHFGAGGQLELLGIGAATFLAHFARSVQPLNLTTYDVRPAGLDQAVGCAASTTALLMLVGASIAAPSPDPGVTWAVMCGIALALRPRRAPQPAMVARAARGSGMRQPA